MIQRLRFQPDRLARAARLFALGWSLAFLVGLNPERVLAHANLDQSRPAVDQTLASSPSHVWLSFTESADPAATGLGVLDGRGVQMDLGDAALSPDGRQAVVSVAPLAPGVYTVTWYSRSAEDGHDGEGFFAFAVGPSSPVAILSIDGPSGSNPGIDTSSGLSISLAELFAQGPRTLEIAVASGGHPVVDAQRVWLRLSSPTLDAGTSTVEAVSQGDGRYLANTWLPSLAGPWQAEVRVRLAGLEDISAVFDIEAGP